MGLNSFDVCVPSLVLDTAIRINFPALAMTMNVWGLQRETDPKLSFPIGKTK